MTGMGSRSSFTSNHDRDDRIAWAREYVQGRTAESIAKEANVTEQTVRNWAKQFAVEIQTYGTGEAETLTTYAKDAEDETEDAPASDANVCGACMKTLAHQYPICPYCGVALSWES